MTGETSIYAALEMAVTNNSDENIIKNLNLMLADSQNLEFKSLSIVKTLLNTKNNEVLKLTCQAIADSAKKVENRTALTDFEIIQALLLLLDDERDISCLIQVSRALGNLCYENDTVREFITKCDGLQKLLSVIESNLDSEFQNVTCGVLCNYLTSNESAQKSALDLNILNLIEQMISRNIEHFADREKIFTHLLLILHALTENLVDTWFSNELCLRLLKILELSMNPEISETCLELLHNQGENDDIKLLMAKEGACELLFNLLEEHKALVQDEDGRALMKLACDLIVLIITGDESMTYLYDTGNGKVYKDMLSWLESDHVDLLITGVLAMGNFARNDSHCIKMVQSGISETLLGILSNQDKVDGQIPLQHALLSALRNLVIPKENKARILNSGLIDVIYPLLTTEQQPLVFKLLGTLRLVIDGQESTALQLAMKQDLLERLVEWCYNSDHPGVRAEAPRMLTWLIKHCHSSKPYPQMIQTKDCIKCLAEMITSSHAVMQNEALLALNLLCATFLHEYNSINLTDNEKMLRANVTENQNSQHNNKPDDNKENLADILVSSDVGKFITFLLNKDSDKVEKEVIANLLTLLECLTQITNVKAHLKQTEVSSALKKCLDRENLKPLYDRINKITNSIDSG